MFREDSTFDGAFTAFGDRRIATSPLPLVAHASGLASACAQEEVGTVAPLYREIARRVPRNAFMRHASTLGETLR